METPTRRARLGAWLKALEARGDLWAAKCLSPEEYADAAAFDKHFKRNIWRWLLYFLIAAAAIGVLAKGIWPALSYGKAFFFAGVGCAYILAVVSTAWFGYRKFTKRPAWVVFLAFIALLIGGAAVGYMAGNLNAGRSITDLDLQKAGKAMAIAVAIGIVLVSFLLGIAHLRLRETTQRAARLQAEADTERLARQSTQAELKLLQAQVEPHFLFNTLANVRHLVHAGSPDALAMLDHLIHYLRTALPEIRSDSSTLEREANLARAYLEIMRLRMGGALEFSIDVPQPLARAPFPPLMLMTLVENALKHGIAPVGRGRIALRAASGEGRLRVEVEDDGQGIGGTIGQGVGLANVRERLRALYGDSARLELSGRDPAGALAAIEVPA
jgi:type II secretory pathway pseudopilin PulG